MAISEETAVITLERLFKNLSTDFGIDFFLIDKFFILGLFHDSFRDFVSIEGPKGVVESEGSFFSLFVLEDGGVALHLDTRYTA